MSGILCCVAAVGLHLGSQHFAPLPNQPEFNNRNPGLYVVFSNQVAVGTFYNSLRRQSSYLGYNLQLATYGPVSFDILVGGITGYPLAKVAPLVLPSARFALTHNVGLRVGFLPRTKVTGAYVVHFMAEYRF